MKIHLIGIGGVGMAGLAVLLKNRGHDVSGCDVHSGSRTRWLESLGIPVGEGHDPRHIAGSTELAIATPAVRSDNEELERAMGECAVRCRGEVLAQLVCEASDSIAVCGSHGKTTTATWIARLLIALGEKVEWAIGGETGDFPVGGGGVGGVLVVEADESDGTLALYHAKTLVVTNCEYDHPDHFKTREEYLECYEAAKRNAGTVIGEDGDDDASLLAQDWFARLPEHNRKNARMAIEVARRRGHADESIFASMPEIVGRLPDRRFQIVWPVGGDSADAAFGTVVTDYAHHPTEMRCAVRMAQTLCTGRLRVLFQPHRYSRTKALLHDFPDAFAGADEVLLCPTYAAFESPIDGGDVTDLHRECLAHSARANRRGPSFELARTCAEAWKCVRERLAAGDVTLLLGAGDIIGLVSEVRKDLGKNSQIPPLCKHNI